MNIVRHPLSLSVLVGMISIAHPSFADTINLRIVETTDIHANVMDYDYYKDKPSEKLV